MRACARFASGLAGAVSWPCWWLPSDRAEPLIAGARPASAAPKTQTTNSPPHSTPPSPHSTLNLNSAMTLLTRALLPTRSFPSALAPSRAFSASPVSAAARALLLISHKSGEIVPATFNAVTAARALGGTVTGVVVGSDEAKGVAEKARR